MYARQDYRLRTHSYVRVYAFNFALYRLLPETGAVRVDTAADQLTYVAILLTTVVSPATLTLDRETSRESPEHAGAERRERTP
jgi:hypothetical protein